MLTAAQIWTRMKSSAHPSVSELNPRTFPLKTEQFSVNGSKTETECVNSGQNMCNLCLEGGSLQGSDQT